MPRIKHKKTPALNCTEKIMSRLAGNIFTELEPVELDDVMRQKETLAIKFIMTCLDLPDYIARAREDLNYDWSVLEFLARDKFFQITKMIEIYSKGKIRFPDPDDFKPYLSNYIKTKKLENFQ